MTDSGRSHCSHIPMTTNWWSYWEIKRYLDSENPGRYGQFTSDEAAK